MNKLPTTDKGWETRLVKAKDKASTGFLDYALSVYDYKESCDKVSGGSVFNQNIENWLGVSAGAASRLCKIGERYGELFPNRKNLPTSTRAIYLLSSLPMTSIERAIKDDVVTPKMTEASVVAFKNLLTDQKAQANIAKNTAEAVRRRDAAPTKKQVDDKVVEMREAKKAEKEASAERMRDMAARMKARREQEAKDGIEPKREVPKWKEEANRKMFESLGGVMDAGDIGKIVNALKAGDDDLVNKVVKYIKQITHSDKVGDKYEQSYLEINK